MQICLRLSLVTPNLHIFYVGPQDNNSKCRYVWDCRMFTPKRYATFITIRRIFEILMNMLTLITRSKWLDFFLVVAINVKNRASLNPISQVILVIVPFVMVKITQGCNLQSIMYISECSFFFEASFIALWINFRIQMMMVYGVEMYVWLKEHLYLTKPYCIFELFSRVIIFFIFFKFFLIFLFPPWGFPFYFFFLFSF